MKCRSGLVLAVLLGFTGCLSQSSTSSAPSDASTSAPVVDIPEASTANPSDVGLPPPDSAAAGAAAPAEPPTEQVKATAGVGKQGQSLEGETGILVESAKAFFRFKQNAIFDIQIPQALKLFEATEGRKPNSQDEFMSKIVTANSINLPQLPAGHKYVYDVENGELKVERPAK